MLSPHSAVGSAAVQEYPTDAAAAGGCCLVALWLQLSNDGVCVLAACGLATQVTRPVLAICRTTAQHSTAQHSTTIDSAG
jgi:hypothetical protein